MRRTSKPDCSTQSKIRRDQAWSSRKHSKRGGNLHAPVLRAVACIMPRESGDEPGLDIEAPTRADQGVDEADGWLWEGWSGVIAGNWACREIICCEVGRVEESQPPPSASINCTLSTICWIRRFTAVC